ncbi:hypothetical protein ACJX0J_022197, partial [Zea mays]
METVLALFNLLQYSDTIVSLIIYDKNLHRMPILFILFYIYIPFFALLTIKKCLTQLVNMNCSHTLNFDKSFLFFHHMPCCSLPNFGCKNFNTICCNCDGHLDSL